MPEHAESVIARVSPSWGRQHPNSMIVFEPFHKSRSRKGKVTIQVIRSFIVVRFRRPLSVFGHGGIDFGRTFTTVQGKKTY